jgi:hypothetical protein
MKWLICNLLSVPADVGLSSQPAFAFFFFFALLPFCPPYNNLRFGLMEDDVDSMTNPQALRNIVNIKRYLCELTTQGS